MSLNPKDIKKSFMSSFLVLKVFWLFWIGLIVGNSYAFKTKDRFCNVIATVALIHKIGYFKEMAKHFLVVGIC